jgi:hypothetical protein
MVLSGADQPHCEIRLINTDPRTDDKGNGGCRTAGHGED